VVLLSHVLFAFPMPCGNAPEFSFHFCIVHPSFSPVSVRSLARLLACIPTDHIVELKDEMEDIENENTLLKNERRATAATVADLQRRVDELTAAMALMKSMAELNANDDGSASAAAAAAAASVARGGDDASSEQSGGAAALRDDA
jgi:hypothetical protein